MKKTLVFQRPPMQFFENTALGAEHRKIENVIVRKCVRVAAPEILFVAVHQSAIVTREGTE